MVIAITGLNRGENPQPGAAVIRSLRRVIGDEHRIVGLVYDPMESGIYVNDGPDVVYSLPYPSAGSAAFLGRLDAILAEEPIDVVIPCLDAELEPMVRIKEALEARGISTLLPSQLAFEARNKHKLTELTSLCDVATPETVAVSTGEDIAEAMTHLKFPLMVKGRYYGAKVTHSRTELQNHFQDSIRQWGAPVLLQEIVQGEEYNLVGLCGKPGEIVGWSAVKKTIKSSDGKGFGGITIHDPELLTIAEKLMAQLKWEGPFELEVLKENGGGYTVIEINPRFPAWVDFPSMLDVNLPAALNHFLQNEPTTLPDCPPGKLFLRHSEELCCDF